MKRILYISVGGEIGYQGPGAQDYVSWEQLVSAIIPANYSDIFDVTALNAPFRAHGEMATPEQWGWVAQTIVKNHRFFDGFVVADSLPSIPYLAAALSHMICTPKPILVTGDTFSHLRAETRAGNSRSNLMSALSLASWVSPEGQGVRGVNICHNQCLLDGAFTDFETMDFNARSYPFVSCLPKDPLYFDANSQFPDFVSDRGIIAPLSNSIRAFAVPTLMPCTDHLRQVTSIMGGFAQVAFQDFHPDDVILVTCDSGDTLPAVRHRHPVGNLFGRLCNFAYSGGLLCLHNRLASGLDDHFIRESIFPDTSTIFLGTLPLSAAWTLLATAMGQKSWDKNQRTAYLQDRSRALHQRLVNPFSRDLPVSRGMQLMR